MDASAATCGDAILVPEKQLSIPNGPTEVTSCPGATTSNSSPEALSVAFSPLHFMEPTAITSLYLAGYCTLFPLPAAAIINIPLL